MIQIATWNVNSVRARLPVLEQWIEQHNADIILLQEIKCMEDAFPPHLYARYNVALWGQKTFNGVAILSKYPLEDVEKGVLEEDEQARYIEAVVSTPQGVIRCASVYVPNGQEMNSPAYMYKLRFLQALEKRMKILHEFEEKVVIGGDFNIAPSDVDVYPEWKNELFCSEKERLAFQALLNIGYYDIGKHKGYTWWDYRGKSFEKNHGMRIDHLLLSPEAVDCHQDVIVDRWVRQDCEKTSDHVPVRLIMKE